MNSTTLDLSGQIALVTGASRGIGEACALALAGKGAHVVALARTEGALEALDDKIRALGGTATLVPLDLKTPDHLDVLASQLHARYGRLDIFVHAAAVLGPLTPASHLEVKAWDEGIAVNLTASWRLIRAMEPLLKASPRARALIFTTGRTLRPKAFWGLYGATKAALDNLVACWADEVENSTIRAALVDPAQMRTRMRAQAYPGENPQTLPLPEEIAPLILSLIAADLPVGPVRGDFALWQSRGLAYEGQITVGQPT